MKTQKSLEPNASVSKAGLILKEGLSLYPVRSEHWELSTRGPSQILLAASLTPALNVLTRTY